MSTALAPRRGGARARQGTASERDAHRAGAEQSCTRAQHGCGMAPSHGGCKLQTWVFGCCRSRRAYDV
eukprot:11615661-Alexandrium_andersonii.AAC.1